MYGIVSFYYKNGSTVGHVTQRFENVDYLSFLEKKKYFFEKQYKSKKIAYKIIGSKHFRYTGKTMEVEKV